MGNNILDFAVNQIKYALNTIVIVAYDIEQIVRRL